MPATSARAPAGAFRSTDVSKRRHPAFVALVAAHAAVMLAWALLRHRHFGSGADLGAYHSVFWNLAHRGTPYNSVERVHQWSNHLEVGLVWLGLPYRLLATPAWLFAAQSLAVAAAALPIEALARRITGDRLIASLAGLAMLLTPQLMLAELADFHAATLCVLPVAILAWGIEVDSPRTVAIAAVAALSLRDQMGLLLQALPALRGPGAALDGGFDRSPRAAALRRAILAVPAAASISAQENVVPHVASRVEVHALPDGEASDDYILLDRQGPARRLDDGRTVGEAIDRLKTSADFTVLVDEAGVLLVQRRAHP